MATDDIQVLVTGQAAVPAGFLVPGNGQIKPKAMNAVFDGTAAAGAFLPTLEIISDAGVVVSRVPAPVVVAGQSAEVTWAPFLGEAAAGSGAAGVGCRVVSSFGFLIASATDTVFNWTTADFDSDHMFENVTHPDRLTCRTAGVYLVLGSAFYGTNNTGSRFLVVTLNGQHAIHTGTDIAFSVEAANPSGGTNTSVAIATTYTLAIGDYVTLDTYQDSGVVLGVSTGPLTFFSAVQVG